ncbi:hypothetical protein [Treponema endosymbiont of Eucomonympha sp.]|uniref:hypothetical protein n=1 Tax=Treponema endosymbiont of Eucomonympha sp. TaxID=1580831 RepID=UPI00075116FE|nr:hypothetical protein [Treponema endosymbiont of Eucomonympha sp.]
MAAKLLYYIEIADIEAKPDATRGGVFEPRADSCGALARFYAWLAGPCGRPARFYALLIKFYA